MRDYLPGLIMLTILLAGCGGFQGPSTGHAVGFIYAVTDAGSAQVPQTQLQLFPAATADPDLRPVSGATVTIVQLNRSAPTSVDGSYGIFNLEPGTYSLRATHPRYGARQWQVTIRAGYTTFGDTIMRGNVVSPIYNNYDYYWWWDSPGRDWSYWDNSGGYVPEPPPTRDSTDDGGGISFAGERGAAGE